MLRARLTKFLALLALAVAIPATWNQLRGALCLALQIGGVSRPKGLRSYATSSQRGKPCRLSVATDSLVATASPEEEVVLSKDRQERLAKKILPPDRQRTYLVTGATDGIGLHTAKLLAQEGHKVLIHGKDLRKVEVAMTKVMVHCAEQVVRYRNKESVNQPDLDGFVADLSLCEEVYDVAEMISESYPVIDGILHNAASIDSFFDGHKVVTKEFNEYTLATNVLAPFALTNALLPNVCNSACGRIIFSSSSNLGGADMLEDLQWEGQAWSANGAYALSKLCLTMMAMELHSRYGDAPKLCIHAFDPGMFNTALARHSLAFGYGKKRRRKDIAARIQRGVLPPLVKHNKSFQMLVDDVWGERSGDCLVNDECIPDEVHDKDARARLWDQLLFLTGTTWPDRDQLLEWKFQRPLKNEQLFEDDP